MIRDIKTFIQLAALGLLFTVNAYAAPELNIGPVEIYETSKAFDVNVAFVNDGTVTAIQFDLEYDAITNGIDAVDMPVRGTALAVGNGIYSVLLAPTTAASRRIVISPTADNQLLSDGQIAVVPFQSLAAALPDGAIDGAVIRITNVVMSNKTGSAAVAPTLVIDGLVSVVPSPVIPPGILSGTIATSGTLDGAYLVTATVTVVSAATLTANPGTVISMAGNSKIIIDGTLRSQGTATNKVVIKSAKANPSRRDWQGIVINSGSTGNIVNFTDIQHSNIGIDVIGAEINISNSLISEYSTIGIKFTLGAGGSITNNTISNVFPAGTHSGTGIYLEDATRSVAGFDTTISGNTLHDAYYALDIERHSSPQVTGNNITKTTHAVLVRGNQIKVDNPNPVVTNNNIYGNSKYNYVAQNYADAANTTLDATNNWWGTTDIAVIQASLLHQINDAGNPKINFMPFLDSFDGTPTTGTALVGPIALDQTLTGGATYDVVENLVVNPGVSLTIPAGTQMRFHGTAMLVDGTLLVQGTTAGPVVFLPVGNNPVRRDWQGIVLNPGSVGNMIDYASIRYAFIGINAVGAEVSISNSVISEYSTIGIMFSQGAGGGITNNSISNVFPSGIHSGTGIYLEDAAVDIAGFNTTISGNTIHDAFYALDIERHSSPQVTGNTITNSTRAVVVQGNQIIVDNPNPVVTNNNIYGNSGYNYVVQNYADATTTSLDATNNWWGSTDIAVIQAGLVHQLSSTSNPKVNFLPFLDAIDGAPTTGTALVGPIALDQTLTGSAIYDVVDELVVNQGVTLTIPASTQFRFHGTALMVDGTLLVQGTAADPVSFASAKSSPSRRDWPGIMFRLGSVGSVIDYATINHTNVGVDAIGAEVTISNSVIGEFSTTGIKFTQGAGGNISNNTIANVFPSGIHSGTGIYLEDAALDVAGFSTTISGNRLHDVYYALDIERHSSPQVVSNTFTNTTHAVFIRGNQLVADDPIPVVTNNSLYGNSGYNFIAQNYANGATTSLDATNNWWGTTDLLLIMDSIFDQQNDASSPVVTFAPILNVAP